MAGISTSIQINDMVTAPIMHMSNALNMFISEFEQMQSVANSSFDNTSFNHIRAEINRANIELDEMTVNIQENASAQNNFNRSVQIGSNEFTLLNSKATALLGTYLTLHSVGSAIGLSDTLTQTTARLNMMNDGMQTTQELQDKIYLSAERSRASYLDTASAISKMGLNAGNAFSSNDELIAFMEQINKQFVVGGASSTEMSSAMLQLTQAMGAGALRGEELNSILDAAPGIARSIEKNMGWAEGSIKSYAEQGLVTAQVVKSSMLNMAEETNAKFESMPMTWSQVWTSMQNVAIRVFTPVLQKINELANNAEFQNMASGVVNVLAFAASAVMGIFDLAAQVYSVLADIGSLIVDNWSILSPFIYGLAAALAFYLGYLAIVKIAEMLGIISKVALCIASYAHATALRKEASETAQATAAQYGFNTALLSCPLTWIIILIIAVIAAIYAVIAVINKVTGSTISATGVIMGVLSTLLAFVENLFFAMFDLILGVINALVNHFVDFANFVGNFLYNPISSIIYMFQRMADTILGVLEKIASAMDFVFGSHMADSIGKWRSGLKEMADNAVAKYAPNEDYQNIMNNLNLSAEDLGFKHIDYSKAYDVGYKFGKSIDDKVESFDPSSLFKTNIPNPDDYASSQIPTNIQNTADNTKSIKDGLELSSEDLKYLRDAAETEIVNRYTTAEIKVDFTNYNQVNSETDLDGVSNYLLGSIEEGMNALAEGEH